MGNRIKRAVVGLLILVTANESLVSKSVTNQRGARNRVPFHDVCKTSQANYNDLMYVSFPHAFQ